MLFNIDNRACKGLLSAGLVRYEDESNNEHNNDEIISKVIFAIKFVSVRLTVDYISINHNITTWPFSFLVKFSSLKTSWPLKELFGWDRPYCASGNAR